MQVELHPRHGHRDPWEGPGPRGCQGHRVGGADLHRQALSYGKLRFSDGGLGDQI